MFKCRNCGETFPEWLETCSHCAAFRSFAHQPQAPSAASGTCPPRRTRGALTTSRDLAKSDLISMPLSPSWRTFLGSLPAEFAMMIWGPAGGGKTSFELGFALELARHGKVMFVAAEEGFGNSLIEKLNRFEVFSDRVLISSAISADEMIADLNRDPEIKFLIIDSIAAMPITVAGLSEIVESRRLGVAFSLHANKANTYRGSTSWGHWVDVILRVEQGHLTLEKNRFGPLVTGRLNWGTVPTEEVQL